MATSTIRGDAPSAQSLQVPVNEPELPAVGEGDARPGELSPTAKSAKDAYDRGQASKIPDRARTEAFVKEKMEPGDLKALLASVGATPLGEKPTGEVAGENAIGFRATANDLLAPNPLDAGDLIGLQAIAELLASGQMAGVPPELVEAMKDLAALSEGTFAALTSDALPKGLDPKLVQDMKRELERLGIDPKSIGKETKALTEKLEAELHGKASERIRVLEKIFGPLPKEVMQQLVKMSPRTLALLAACRQTAGAPKTNTPPAPNAPSTPTGPSQDEIEKMLGGLGPLTIPRHDETTATQRQGMENLFSNMLANGADIEQLMMVAMFNARSFGKDELKEALEEMQKVNGKKRQQREFMQKMREQRTKMERDLRERYDARVRNGEIDPTLFTFDDFKESQKFDVFSATGDAMPGTDASEAGSYEFAMGDDVSVPTPPPPESGGGVEISQRAEMPPGVSEETFASRLHISVEELHQLMALYDTIPDETLRSMTGTGSAGRMSFVQWLTRFQDGGGVGLEAVEGGASQSQKVQAFLSTYPAKVEEKNADIAANNERRAARDAERDRIKDAFGLDDDQARKLQNEYKNKFADQYATFDDYAMDEVGLSKQNKSENKSTVDTRFDTSARDAKIAGFAALMQFADDYGLSKGEALALLDYFRKMNDRPNTDFGMVPGELFEYLQDNVDGFSENHPERNGEAVSSWLTNVAAVPPPELTGSTEGDPSFQDLMGEMNNPAMTSDGKVRDSHDEDSYRKKARELSEKIDAFGDAHIKDQRPAIDALLQDYFRQMMMEAYFTAQDDNEGKRKWYDPEAAYQKIVDKLKQLGEDQRGFGCDYVELRVAEFARDMTASLSKSARDALGETARDAAIGAGAAVVADLGASVASGIGVFFLPITLPAAAIGGALAGAFEPWGNDLYSAFLPENTFGNVEDDDDDDTQNWELFDEQERERYNKDNKNEGEDSKKQQGMWFSTRPNDACLFELLKMLGENKYFGSQWGIDPDDHKLAFGFAQGGRESREVSGIPTSNLRNDVFETSDNNGRVENEAYAAAAAQKFMEQGDAYGSAADRNRMKLPGTSSRDLNGDGTVDAADLAIADGEVQQLMQLGGGDALEAALRQRAIIAAIIKAREKAVEGRERAATQQEQLQSYLLVPDAPPEPAPGEGNGESGEGRALRQITLADLDAKIQGWRDGLDSLSELGEEQQLHLQILMDRFTQIQTMLSNLMKKVADTNQNIIANLK